MVAKSFKDYYKGIALTVIILLLSAYFVTSQYPNNRIAKNFGREIITAFSNDKKGNFIVIDKGKYSLAVFKDFVKQKEYNVTIGKNHGTKRVPGDDRTPEGIFHIRSLEKASHWAYDFPHDTLPPIVGAYGPWFIRLDVPGFEGIGIHGFLNDEWIGKRKSNGCVRLNNDELSELVKMVRPGMLVIIQPSNEDLEVGLN